MSSTLLSQRIRSGASLKLGKMKEMVRQKALSLSDSVQPSLQSNRAPMDYTVTPTDSLERIAAAHDCTVGELMKLNRMGSRMVFPGQKILVPSPMSDDVFDASAALLPAGISGAQAAPDGIRKGPGGAVPSNSRGNLLKTQSAPTKSDTADGDSVDSDCLQRFLKIKVKQLTESDGTVTGTLLVTPNCLMFDPDVSHPLVKENGPDLYGMVANMDDIMAVSVYKDVGALMGDKSGKKKEIFRPQLQDPPKSPRISSETQLPSITEEKAGKDSPQLRSPITDEAPRKRSISDGDEAGKIVDDDGKPRAELRAAQSFGSSAKAKSGVQTMAKGAESVAHGVVTHTKSAADSLQTGIQTSAKVVGDSAKAAADRVAQLPENIVNKGSELIADGVNGVSGFFAVEQEQRTPQQLKRDQSLATLEGLRQKTAAARQEAVSKGIDQTANSRSESETDTSAGQSDAPSSPIMPYFMAVRLTRKKMRKSKATRTSSINNGSSVSSYDDDCLFGNRLKREFWFTIPRNKADSIYGFLLQWSPEKYGQDTEEAEDSSAVTIPKNHPSAGFIVLDAEADEALSALLKSCTKPMFYEDTIVRIHLKFFSLKMNASKNLHLRRLNRS
ncbi:unnamed protein product, partial [Mesorhabditis spiculigera]